MALLFFDGFETYGSSATMDDGMEDVYDIKDDASASGVSIISSNRITGGQAMRILLNLTNDLSTVLSQGPQLPLAGLSSEDDWIVGAAVRATGGLGASGTTRAIYEFLDSDDGHMLSLRVEDDGDLALERISGNTITTLATAAGAISGTDWHFVELKVNFHQSTGSYKVRVDETTVMSGGPVNTTASGATRPCHLRFGHIASQPLDLDDLYILDDTGSVNNDFLGDIRVQRLRPNGVGDDTDFSSTGTNWEEVNELAEDDDTSYVQSATAAARDLYHYEDLPSVPDTIFGVVAKPVLKKSDAGSRTYKLLAKSDGVEADSGTRYPANSYVRQAYVFETDPATGAFWTAEAVNHAQFGLEIVA